MVLAHIALGSNIEPEKNLPAAVTLLAERLRLTGRSRVYRTPPWGFEAQANFLNAVVAAETALAPEALLELLQELEQKLGRLRAIPNGPRTMDLDLLLYGELVMDSPRLSLPHPRLHERAFALAPLCDLGSALKHPVLGVPFSELLQKADRSGIVATPFRLPG